jgi:hypothetical protein
MAIHQGFVHQFVTGNPLGLTGASGWIRQTEISAGVAWMR